MRPNILSVLSKGECEDLGDAGLKILEEIGIRVTLPEAVDLLLRAGAKLGEDGRVCLDASLVRDLVGRAPAQFRLYDRVGGSIDIGSGRNWTICGGTVSRILDWPGWALRPASRDDVADLTRLCDALPLVHAVVPMAEAQDVEPSQAEVISFLETVTNTTKFTLVCPVLHSSAKAWVEMARLATGIRDLSREPSVGLFTTVLPSLHLDDDCAATTILSATEGIPMVAGGGGIAGSSGPNTIAGLAAMKLAGELLIVALAQVVRPGTPVLLSVGVAVMDMNTADIGEAGPEYPLGAVALAHVAREFGLPAYSGALHCEAKTGDFQAGLEKMGGLMAAVLAGVDVTTNMGMLSRCSAASCEQLVVDDELCAFLDRFDRGVTVNEDTLALDVIRQVGLGGDFITHEHTVKHCRSGEIWYPTLLDRSAVGTDSVDLYERAHTRVSHILREHRPQVDPQVRKDLERYVQRAG